MKPDFVYFPSTEAPSLAYTIDGQDKLFSIRLFLRGAILDKARGDPARSRESLQEILPSAGPLIAPRQIHGRTILSAPSGGFLPHRREGDGVFLDERGVEGSLRFADCFPVVLFSEIPEPWILLLHSGFKGTVQDIAGTSCDKVFSRGGRDPEKTWAWIGPGIEKTRYCRTLGEEWTDRGLQIFHPTTVDILSGKAWFDLEGQIRRQILAAGIRKDRICTFPLGTFGQTRLCYSYRRGDLTGRHFLLASLR
ncbi:MAG: polyphenol oxidase family protein [Synergistaceae bacterium]|nr:polyphenol oxidase family protein [Synergistaceae bacterium]